MFLLYNIFLLDMLNMTFHLLLNMFLHYILYNNLFLLLFMLHSSMFLDIYSVYFPLIMLDNNIMLHNFHLFTDYYLH